MNLTSDAYFPVYKLKHEIRDIKPDPTSQILFKLYILDRYTGKIRLVGCTTINLFVDTDLSSQPLNQKCSSFHLNQGGHQLPFYYDLPNITSPFTVERITNELIRVPCCSLLIRIASVGNNDTGIHTFNLAVALPMPNYEDLVYDSTRSVPKDYEQLIFPFVCVERPPLMLRDALVGFPETKRMTDEHLLEFFAFALTKPLDGVVRNNGLRYLCKYDSRPGFKLQVMSAQCLKTKGFTFVNVKMLNAKRNAKQLAATGGITEQFDFLTTKLDFKNSCALSPVWIDGPQWIRHYDYKPNSYFLFEVYTSLTRANSQGQDCVYVGWTIAYIFDSHGYCHLGSFQLPLV